VLYVYIYFWLRPMRIKLNKILDHTCLEICLPNESMPPLGTFVSYWLHLILSSCCIEDWAFSEKSIYFIAITFSVLFHLHLYTTKTQKHIYLLFPVKLANQYPSSSWVWQHFIYLKGTTIDLLHLGVISNEKSFFGHGKFSIKDGSTTLREQYPALYAIVRHRVI
jgi:hypothetical protein